MTTIGELVDLLRDIEAKYGADTEVIITGAYGSTGVIESVSFDEETGEVLINSDIMSG